MSCPAGITSGASMPSRSVTTACRTRRSRTCRHRLPDGRRPPFPATLDTLRRSFWIGRSADRMKVVRDVLKGTAKHVGAPGPERIRFEQERPGAVPAVAQKEVPGARRAVQKCIGDVRRERDDEVPVFRSARRAGARQDIHIFRVDEMYGTVLPVITMDEVKIGRAH